MKLRKIILITSILAFMLSASACKDSTPLKTSSKTDGTAQQVTEENAETQAEIQETEAVDPVSTVQNPLTGEYGYNEAAVNKRPVAIMINNISQSLPQYGIGSADYIYEIIVEGGITRMMAVFADYTSVPDVCSIRSCRYYFPRIAYGLDAIYCHWGMDHTIAEETLENLDIDRFDGDDSRYYESLFFNDEERLETYDREHTGYLKGSVLADTIANAGYRTDITDPKNSFVFNEGEQPVVPTGVPCTSFTVNFSESYFSTFTFDQASGTYLKQHSGESQIDASTGEQLAFTNVFVLETSVSVRDDYGRMDVALDGGTGYYISNGSAQQISWSKPSDDSNFIITDNSGNAITVNRGKCYFGITRSFDVE